MLKIAYRTELGTCYNGTIEDALRSRKIDPIRGKVNLIFTSPPFPLNRKKKYGNRQGEEYIRWLSDLAVPLTDLLAPDGSIVMEVGNSWNAGEPTMSTLALESLLSFLRKGDLKLCQQFIWNNPAKLPSPAQWVNIERSRVKDSFTQIWWMSKISKPKADNRNILVEYSKSMKRLIETGKYNSGARPSEHVISESAFARDNSGAIPSSVITCANTHSNTNYQRYCKDNGLVPHPARMPHELVEYFIRFLTNKGDLVMDPFGGSNTTGMVAEELERRWIVTEPNEQYILGSNGRFKHHVEDVI
jgi:DNA modification methylase